MQTTTPPPTPPSEPSPQQIWQDLSATGHRHFALDNFPQAITIHQHAANYALEKIDDGYLSYAESLFHLASVYFRLKQYMLAIEFLRPCTEIYRAHLMPPPAAAAQAFMLLGHCQYASALYRDAAQTYDQSISYICQAVPGWHPIAQQIAQCLLRCHEMISRSPKDQKDQPDTTSPDSPTPSDPLSQPTPPDPPAAAS